MPHLPNHRDLVLEFSNPGQLMDGIDERHGALFVPWMIPGVSAGDKVMAEFTFKGRKELFDLRATVRWVRQHGTELMPAGVALDIHKEDSLKLRKLVVWLKGGEVQYFKRRHVRYPVELECKVAHGAVQADATLIDISEGGAFISLHGSELPTIGTDVELHLRLPGSFLRGRFKLPARVMWLDFFEDSRGFGVQFPEPPPDGVLKLLERVKHQRTG